MFKYILKRILFGIMTVWLIATLTFFLMHVMPGDPFLSEKAVPVAVRQKLLEKYNLDKPLHTQYFIYMKNLVKGDLGISMKYRNRRIGDVIKKHFPYSLDLSINALILALSLGLIIGIIAALNRGKFFDTFSILVAVIGISVPSFVLSGLLQLIFSSWLKWLPYARYEGFRFKILPTIAVAIGPLAVIARMTRASVIEVLNQDFIKTARSKGLPLYRIVWKHILRNAIMPVIAYVGQLFATISTGSYVIERMFVIPGLGNSYVESIENQDYTMVFGLTIFYSIILVSVLAIVDILYKVIDPRVRLTKKS